MMTMYLSDKVLEEVLNGPIEKQIQAIWDLFVDDDPEPYDHEIDETPDYDFLISVSQAFIDDIDNTDFTPEQRPIVVKVLKNIIKHYEEERRKNV